MLQKLIEILLGRHTIEGALFHFNKAIEKLDAVEKQEAAEIERRKQEIAESSAALDIATAKATIARNRANKLRDFFGETEDLAPNINTLRAIS
jgi:hypothetical protein